MSALVIETSGPKTFTEFVMKGAFSTPDKFASSSVLSSVATLNPEAKQGIEARLQALQSLIDQSEKWIAARAVFWIACFDAEQILQQTALGALPDGSVEWLLSE